MVQQLNSFQLSINIFAPCSLFDMLKKLPKNSIKRIWHAVNRKWRGKEREVWYAKFSKARQRRLLKLSESQNHQCAYCGCRTWLAAYGEKGPNSQRATLEHVVPVSCGGTERYDNTVMACCFCNSHRGARDAFAFYKWLQENRIQFLPDSREHASTKRERRREKREEDPKALAGRAHMVWAIVYLGHFIPFFRSYPDLVIAKLRKKVVDVKQESASM